MLDAQAGPMMDGLDTFTIKSREERFSEVL
jgi:hypothetical protein